MPIQIPEKPAAALAALHKAGIGAWVVGGAVRDSLLERPVSDWDLTAACQPEQLLAALPQAKPIGGVYGTVSWHGVEITPCRKEEGYTDNRHPDHVTFDADIRSDLARRDFTVNAIAYDGQIAIDPYHGHLDLQERLLRCVGEPKKRFAEDALRILRLYRFAGVLDFSIEEQTNAAALALAHTLATVSAPRVRGELNKALNGARPSALTPLIAAGGLEAFAIPSQKLVQQPEQLAVLDRIPNTMLCRWWAFLRLTGADTQAAAKVFDFGRGFVRDMARLDALYAAGCPQDIHALKLLLMEQPPFPPEDAFAAFAAMDSGFAKLPQMYQDLLVSREPYQKQHLRITPAELLVEGIPGRKIGKVQECLVKAVVDTPSLNVYPTLAQMAKGLKKVL